MIFSSISVDVQGTAATGTTPWLTRLGSLSPVGTEQGSVEHPEKASSWAKPSVTLIWVLSFDCPGKSQHFSWPLSSQQKSTSHTAEARRIRRPQGASAWRFYAKSSRFCFFCSREDHQIWWISHWSSSSWHPVVWLGIPGPNHQAKPGSNWLTICVDCFHSKWFSP